MLGESCPDRRWPEAIILLINLRIFLPHAHPLWRQSAHPRVQDYANVSSTSVWLVLCSANPRRQFHLAETEHAIRSKWPPKIKLNLHDLLSDLPRHWLSSPHALHSLIPPIKKSISFYKLLHTLGLFEEECNLRSRISLYFVLTSRV